MVERAGSRRGKGDQSTEQAKARQKWQNDTTCALVGKDRNVIRKLVTGCYPVAVFMPVGSAASLLKHRCHQAPRVNHLFSRIRLSHSAFPIEWSEPR
jgi:hypothetical protein